MVIFFRQEMLPWEILPNVSLDLISQFSDMLSVETEGFW